MPHKFSEQLPEKTLRHIWQHQCFVTTNLQTAEGKNIEVVSPGNSNADGGPDFVDASVRIGGVLYRGDVELHVNDDAWKQHAHHLDPKYNKVILHVVLNKNRTVPPPYTRSKRLLPVLILDKYLPKTGASIQAKNPLPPLPGAHPTLPCEAANDPVEGSHIRTWLGKLAVERMELKVRRFEERLRQLIEEHRLSINEPLRKYGEIPFGIDLEEPPPLVSACSPREFSRASLWNQLLYEGVMEALGYSKNQAAFRKLAWSLQLQSFRRLLSSVPPEQQVLGIEAILFGVSGLLQQHRKRHDLRSRERLQELRRIWKKSRSFYGGEMLNEAEWQFFRLRPENFPTIRLAGAARLVPRFLDGDMFKSIIHIVKDAAEGECRPLKQLKSFFIVVSDEFWIQHYCFGGRSNVMVKNLVGEHRAYDIVLNVIVPVCLLYARIFRDKGVRSGILHLLEECPSSGDNAVTRVIKHQLLREKITIDSAMLQQGALQLYKFYCLERRCNDCAIGKAVFGGRSTGVPVA